MKEKIELLRSEIKDSFKTVTDLKSLNELRTKYLNKKGPVQELSSVMRDLSIDEKTQKKFKRMEFFGKLFIFIGLGIAFFVIYWFFIR